MTYSMTAFARKEQSYDFGTLQIEIKSVNQRYLEPTFRLHETLRPLEMKLRDILKQRVKRGKVEVNVRFHVATGESGLDIDEGRLAAVSKALEKITNSVANTSPINPVELLQYPGVLIDAELDVEAVHETAVGLFEEALGEFIAGRKREGDAMADAIQERLVGITDIVAEIRKEAPEWVQTFRDNLREKAQGLGVELDSERLEQEVALLAQIADVAEELDRLDADV